MKVRFVFAQFQIRAILYMYNRLSGKDVLQSVIHVARKKIQVLPEPMTFWLLVQPCSTTELQETRCR